MDGHARQALPVLVMTRRVPWRHQHRSVQRATQEQHLHRPHPLRPLTPYAPSDSMYAVHIIPQAAAALVKTATPLARVYLPQALRLSIPMEWLSSHLAVPVLLLKAEVAQVRGIAVLQAWVATAAPTAILAEINAQQRQAQVLRRKLPQAQQLQFPP